MRTTLLQLGLTKLFQINTALWNFSPASCATTPICTRYNPLILSMGISLSTECCGSKDSYPDNTSATIINLLKSSPLYSHTFSAEDLLDKKNIIQKGELVARNFGVKLVTNKPARLERRIFQYYIPVYNWIRRFRDKIDKRSTLVVGISAPQGCGKTTLSEQLKSMLHASGSTCVSISIDDFYLTGSEQEQLAQNFQRNSLLRLRGNPGSHDLKLGKKTLDDLKRVTYGEHCQIPRYDKSLRDGKGDRLPPEKWSLVYGPVDVILFEGWCLGFQPLPETSPELDAEGDSLRQVNSFLRKYSQWHDMCDIWLVIKALDINYVFDWRLEAERKMRELCGQGMSDEQVSDFVQRFMPAYRAYLPNLHSQSQQGTPKLVVTVNMDREPIGSKIF